MAALALAPGGILGPTITLRPGVPRRPGWLPRANPGTLATRGVLAALRARPLPALAPPLAMARGGVLAGQADAAGELRDMRAIAAGDERAFGRVVEREAPRLLRFAQGMLGSLEEAEDVVQDTLARLWENAAKWTPDARIGTWLHRVCYNRAIDRLRRRRDFVDDSALEGLSDGAEPADEALVKGEAIRSVHAALALLPSRQRTALLLFHFQELPQREAAEVMGISEAALESLLARARRQMRRLIAEDDNG